MTFTASKPMPHSTDLAAAPAFYTNTLDCRLDSRGADAGWTSLPNGSLALMPGARQAASDAAAVGQAPCR